MALGHEGQNPKAILRSDLVCSEPDLFLAGFGLVSCPSANTPPGKIIQPFVFELLVLSSVVSLNNLTQNFASASYSQALFQFGLTMVLYIASIALMFLLLPESYGWVMLLGIVASIAHVRLFMIGHDCAHRSYFPEKWQNVVVGNLIGVLTNTPLRYWGTQHSKHHRTVGNLDHRGAGDVVTWTIDEYQQASWVGRLWYRINRSPLILFAVFAPIHFLFMQRWPLEQKKPSFAIWRSVMGTNLGMLVYYGALVGLFGAKAVALVYLPVIWLSSVAAVWLFYIQHQFDTAYWQRDDQWSYEDATLKGSSFYDLSPWGHWMTGNIGYHHLHHLNPKIPNYRLKACFNAHPEFHEVKTIGFFESFQYATLSLWDEDQGRLVPFKYR